MAFAATRASGTSAHTVARGDTTRPGRAEPMPSIQTLQKVYQQGTSAKSGCFLKKEVAEWIRQLEKSEMYADADQIFIAMGFDATDITAELYWDPRTYKWTGDVNLAVIGGHNPQELEQAAVTMMKGLDAVLDCSTCEEMQPFVMSALEFLVSQVHIAEAQAVAARLNLRQKIASFMTANKRAEDKQAVAQTTQQQDETNPTVETPRLALPAGTKLRSSAVKDALGDDLDKKAVQHSLITRLVAGAGDVHGDGVVKAVGSGGCLVVFGSGRMYVYDYAAVQRTLMPYAEYTRQQMGALKGDTLKATCRLLELSFSGLTIPKIADILFNHYHGDSDEDAVESLQPASSSDVVATCADSAEELSDAQVDGVVKDFRSRQRGEIEGLTLKARAAERELQSLRTLLHTATSKGLLSSADINAPVGAVTPVPPALEGVNISELTELASDAKAEVVAAFNRLRLAADKLLAVRFITASNSSSTTSARFYVHTGLSASEIDKIASYMHREVQELVEEMGSRVLDPLDTADGGSENLVRYASTGDHQPDAPLPWRASLSPDEPTTLRQLSVEVEHSVAREADALKENVRRSAPFGKLTQNFKQQLYYWFLEEALLRPPPHRPAHKALDPFLVASAPVQREVTDGISDLPPTLEVVQWAVDRLTDPAQEQLRVDFGMPADAYSFFPSDWPYLQIIYDFEALEAEPQLGLAEGEHQDTILRLVAKPCRFFIQRPVEEIEEVEMEQPSPAMCPATAHPTRPVGKARSAEIVTSAAAFRESVKRHGSQEAAVLSEDALRDPGMRWRLDVMAMMKPVRRTRALQLKMRRLKELSAPEGYGTQLRSDQDMARLGFGGQRISLSAATLSHSATSYDEAPLLPFHQVAPAPSGCITAAQLQMEDFMRTAVHCSEINASDMLSEIEVVRMDRRLQELAQKGIDFRKHFYIPGQSHMFNQCPSHKCKNLVQHFATLLDKGCPAIINAKKLEEVAHELAMEDGAFWPLSAALTRKTDMQGEASLIFLLICPAFLDRLLTKGYETEFVMLEAVGMAFLAYTMPGLDADERVRRIELVQTLLCYNIIGEALFLPGGDGDGVRSAHFGGLAAGNLLALLANADVLAAIRERFPEMWRQLNLNSTLNNHVESYFAELSQQLGYKASMRMIEPRSRKVDWANLERHDEDRVYDRAGTKKEGKYSVLEHKRSVAYLQKHISRAPHSVPLFAYACRRRDVLTWWNNGASIDPESEGVNEHLNKIHKRARHDATARSAAIRSHFKGHAVG